MGRKRKKARFGFGSAENLTLDSKGRRGCNICCRIFVIPDVSIELFGFEICPPCVLSGPRAVAAEAKSRAEDPAQIAKYWGYEDNDDPEDVRGMQGQYRGLAMALLGVESFLDIPGGAVALAIAGVSPEDIQRGYRGKAA